MPYATEGGRRMNHATKWAIFLLFSATSYGSGIGDVHAMGNSGCHGAAFELSASEVGKQLAEGRALDSAKGVPLIYLAALYGFEQRLRQWVPENLAYLKADPTALMHSAGAGQLGSVRILLDGGLDVNVRDTDGSTPIMAAVTCGRLSVAKYLVLRGADVNAKNNSHADAMILAVVARNHSMASFLLKSGFDLASSRSAKGRSPLEIAKSIGDKRMERLLGSAK